MEIVLAVREEIQHSEVPEQSVIFQGLNSAQIKQAFNSKGAGL